MAIKAVWRINTGDKVYEPGEVIAGLSSSEETRLVSMGAAVLMDYPVIDNVTAPVESDDDVQLDALRVVLGEATKKELLAYAERAEIKGVTGTMKNDDILNAILADAKTNGIDLEAFTDDQLVQFAKAAGVEVDEVASREGILDAIEAHFG